MFEHVSDIWIDYVREFREPGALHVSAQLLKTFCGEFGRLPFVLAKLPTNVMDIAETTNAHE